MTDEAQQKANLSMWDSISHTDPRYTKQFDRGGFKGTAINGTYVAMQLTRLFGPCGIGWRFVIDEERLIEGPAVSVKTVRKETIIVGNSDPVTIDTETTETDRELLHVIRGHIEYRRHIGLVLTNKELSKFETVPPSEWCATGPQFGQTKMCIRNKNGLMFDEEAPKKSVTDCLSKCAVLLGIASDVHMGLYDDNKYVNERKAEFAEKPAFITQAQAAELNKALAAAGLKPLTFIKKYGIPTVESLPADKYQDAVNSIAEYAAKKAADAKRSETETQPGGKA